MYFRKWPRYYRSPRTTQERRATPSGFPYARAGRNMKNLPTSYDDICVRHQKSWKGKRKTQYYVGGRGEAKTIYIEASSEYISDFSWAYKGAEWTLRDFLDENRITYVAETVREGSLHWCSYRNQWQVWYRTVGYKITYWSKKDLSKALTFLGIGV